MNTLLETNKLIEQYTAILFRKWDKIKKLRQCFTINLNSNEINNDSVSNKALQKIFEIASPEEFQKRNKILYIDVIFIFYYALINCQYTYSHIHSFGERENPMNTNNNSTLSDKENLSKIISENINTNVDAHPNNDSIKWKSWSQDQFRKAKLKLTKLYLQDIQELNELRMQLLEKSKLIRNWLYQLKEFQYNILYFILQRNNSNNNEEEKSLTSKEFTLINNIHSLLFTVTNELPSILSSSQQEKFLSKLVQYSQYIIQNNQILSLNTYLYQIFKNTNIYEDNIVKNEKDKRLISNSNTLSFTSSLIEYYIQYYQYHYHLNKNTEIANVNIPWFTNNNNKHQEPLKSLKKTNNMDPTSNNNNNNNNNNNIQEEDSWAEITSKSEFSILNNKSPYLSEVYKHHIHSSSSLESFSIQSEEINEHLDDQDHSNTILMEHTIDLDNSNSISHSNNNSSIYSRSEFIHSVDSFKSNTSLSNYTSKLKSPEPILNSITNSNISTTPTLTAAAAVTSNLNTNNNNNNSNNNSNSKNNNNNNINNNKNNNNNNNNIIHSSSLYRFLPINNYQKSDHGNKGFTSFSPIQSVIPSSESLTSISNINSEMYHDNNSYSEKINKSKLDLQKIITNDKSLSPYHRYSNSFNTTTSHSNISTSNSNLSHSNSNKRHSNPISRFSRSKINDFDSSEIHNSNNSITSTNTNSNANNDGNITPTSNTNSNNGNRNSLQLLRDISFKISKSPTILSSKLFENNASFIRSEPVSFNNISQYANSNSNFNSISSLNSNLNSNSNSNSNSNLDSNSNSISNSISNSNLNQTLTTTSNSLVDIFLVTKPKKVGLNILNQHIEYAVIARKYGEKDIIGYKRYSDFVKLRDHLYAMCQKLSNSKINSKSNSNCNSDSNSYSTDSFYNSNSNSNTSSINLSSSNIDNDDTGGSTNSGQQKQTHNKYSSFTLINHLHHHHHHHPNSHSHSHSHSHSNSNSNPHHHNIMKRDTSYDDHFNALGESISMNKKEKQRSITSFEINKLIKAFGGTGFYDPTSNDYNGEDYSLDPSPSLVETATTVTANANTNANTTASTSTSLYPHEEEEEDKMAVANRVLPPFPQKKIVGKFNIKFIEKRRESLQNFLNDILMEPSLEFLISTIRQWITNEIEL